MPKQKTSILYKVTHDLRYGGQELIMLAAMVHRSPKYWIVDGPVDGYRFQGPFYKNQRIDPRTVGAGKVFAESEKDAMQTARRQYDSNVQHHKRVLEVNELALSLANAALEEIDRGPA